MLSQQPKQMFLIIPVTNFPAHRDWLSCVNIVDNIVFVRLCKQITAGSQTERFCCLFLKITIITTYGRQCSWDRTHLCGHYSYGHDGPDGGQQDRQMWAKKRIQIRAIRLLNADIPIRHKHLGISTKFECAVTQKNANGFRMHTWKPWCHRRRRTIASIAGTSSRHSTIRQTMPKMHIILHDELFAQSLRTMMVFCLCVTAASYLAILRTPWIPNNSHVRLRFWTQTRTCGLFVGDILHIYVHACSQHVRNDKRRRRWRCKIDSQLYAENCTSEYLVAGRQWQQHTQRGGCLSTRATRWVEYLPQIVCGV